MQEPTFPPSPRVRRAAPSPWGRAALGALLVALASLTGARAARADATLLWAAHTSGRMVDIYDPDRSDRNVLAAGYEFSQLASAAYDDDDAAVAAAVARHRFELLESEDHQFSNTQYILVRDGSRAVVAFRGTEDGPGVDWDEIADWGLNAQAIAVPSGPFQGAHVGFALAAATALTTLREHLSDLRGEGVREIWLVGHSLGGAIAQLVALALEYAEMPVAGVVAFGSPAPGQWIWTEHYEPLESRTHLFESDSDLVPCTPPDQSTWQRSGIGHRLTGEGVLPYSGRTDCTNVATEIFHVVNDIAGINPLCAAFSFKAVQKGRAGRRVRMVLRILLDPRNGLTCDPQNPVEGIIDLGSSFLIDGRDFGSHKIGRYREEIALSLPDDVFMALEALP